jgi:hypothetical protein
MALSAQRQAQPGLRRMSRPQQVEKAGGRPRMPGPTRLVQAHPLSAEIVDQIADQQSIEQAKRDCRYDEHINRSDPTSVIAEECPPALGRRVSSPDHVLSHAGLSDTDAMLEEFSMDSRRSPQRIGNAHLADKLAYLQRNRWPAAPRFRFKAPM